VATLVDSKGKSITTSGLTGFSVRVDGEQYAIVQAGEGTAYTCSISKTLTAEKESRSVFTIYMGEKLDKSIYVKVEAVPSDEGSYEASNQYKLARIFGFREEDDGADTTDWTGTFSDSGIEQAEKISQLSAFNYTMSGNGKGTITLTWNTAYVEISPLFLSTYGLTASSNGTLKSVEISVDHTEQSDYQLQFFRTQTPDAGEVWSASDHSVKCGDAVYVTFAFQKSE
jgi:hypothetical protein